MQPWPILLDVSNTNFKVGVDDFDNLEIRDAGNGTGLHYFYNTAARKMVTDFIIDDRPQVATMCQVTLIKKPDGYSPRIKLWKKDKRTLSKKALTEPMPENETTRMIKALVDTDDCHENFWQVVNFLQSFSGITLPKNDFRIISGSDLELTRLMQGKDKNAILKAVKITIGSELSEHDILILANRKAQLAEFNQLLSDPEFFEIERARRGKHGPEAVWQDFFERNSWIFGYGLNLISCESFDGGKLEKITTGASVFTGAGKRSDGILRTRGFISSLLFCEIKTSVTPLLAGKYREPDVYQISKELTGGVAQVQKTAYKAVKAVTAEFHRHFEDDGTPTTIDVGTVKPRQVLVIGELSQLSQMGQANPEMYSTFELYRRSIIDVEIITFDELCQRAKFIIGDAEAEAA